jgi:hypothetical protein
METDGLEDFRLALPPYLSAAHKRELIAQLRRHPNNTDYYAGLSETEPVQGDGWRGLLLLNFDDGSRDAVLGMVLSNSCDISVDNEPDPDQRLLFAPVLDLAAYVRFLHEAGKNQEQVTNYLNEIRKQSVHRIFYLPPMHGQFDESIVPLDAVYSQPLNSIDPPATTRVFSLSMYGWYVLLVKLSIHFTRMQENVHR